MEMGKHRGERRESRRCDDLQTTRFVHIHRSTTAIWISEPRRTSSCLPATGAVIPKNPAVAPDAVGPLQVGRRLSSSSRYVSSCVSRGPQSTFDAAIVVEALLDVGCRAYRRDVCLSLRGVGEAGVEGEGSLPANRHVAGVGVEGVEEQVGLLGQDR